MKKETTKKLPNSLIEYEIQMTIHKDTDKSLYKVNIKGNPKEVYCLKEVYITTKNKLKYINSIEILKHLKHSHIIRLYHYFHENDNLYIVYEYCNGSTLHELINKKLMDEDSLTEREILQFSIQIFSGLMYLHSKGIVHRDISYDNIILNENMVKIKGFTYGIEDRSLTKSEFDNEKEENKRPFKAEALFGSIYFKSPELVSYYDYNFLVDTWSVGILLLYLYNKDFPYKNRIEDKIKFEIINENLDMNIYKINSESSEITMFLSNVIKSLLNKSLNKRISSKEAFYLIENYVISSNFPIEYEKNSKRVKSCVSSKGVITFDTCMNKEKEKEKDNEVNEDSLRLRSQFKSNINLSISKNHIFDGGLIKHSKSFGHMTPKEIEDNAIKANRKLIENVDLRTQNFEDVMNMSQFKERKVKKELTIKDVK